MTPRVVLRMNKKMSMRLRLAAFALAASALASGAACRGARQTNGEAQSKSAHALPDEAFRAQITLTDPPAKLRAGQQERVEVRVRNASPVFWWARGGETNERDDNKYRLAAADRWLKADGALVTDMDGRHGLLKDLRPGEEAEVLLLVNAPKEPGEYILEVDLVQEQVAWFGEKGSPTARAKVSVVR
jgi:hypothetical protein